MDPENIENLNPNNEPENLEKDQDQPPAKKKRVRKSKAKKHQVGAKVKKRNQKNYRKEPAKVPPAEAENEPIVIEDQVAFELEPLPDLPDKSKKLRLFFRFVLMNGQ